MPRGHRSFYLGRVLDVEGRTFLEHLLEITEHPRVGVRRIVTGANHAEIVRRLPLPADIVVMNRSWQRGQLSSIRAAIESLRSVETEGMMVTLVDHPLITKAVVESLIAAFDRSPRSIVLPTWQGRFEACQAMIGRLKSAGGQAEMLAPPDRGIRGNSHMIMQDKNSLQIADLILQWIGANAGKK